MNREQIEAWMKYHAGLFPYWGEFLGTLTEYARAETFDAILIAMEPFSPESAREASRGIQSGRIKRPFFTEEHIAAVAADCRERAATVRREHTEPYDGCQPLCEATQYERAEARSIIAEARAACLAARADLLAARAANLTLVLR
jgi:hypothetical protein